MNGERERPAGEPNNDGSMRVNVVFSAEQFAKLKEIAQTQGISLADALSQAIHVTGLIVEAKRDADTHILFKRGESLQELKLAS